MKERMKSILLAMLVVSNFILGSKALSNKKLWSDFGCNFFSDGFFSSVRQIFSHKQTVKANMESPQMLIVNTGYQTSRLALTGADSEFEPLVSLLKEYLTDAFGHMQKFTQVNSDEFYAALLGKSVLMCYPVKYDAAFFAYLLGIGDADIAQSFGEIENIIVTADATVLVEDSTTGRYYRMRTSRPQQQINLAIDAHRDDSDNESVINYAADLGFDNAFGSQRTVLSPNIPIYSNALSLNTVASENSLLRADGSINEAVLHEILALFEMNPNILRRYTDAEGTVVFVENNSVLKISADGILEYVCHDGGVPVSGGVFSSSFAESSAAADFVGKINTCAGCENTMQPSEDMTAELLGGNAFEIGFDYTVNGRRVLQENTDAAVRLKVETGYITYYRQVMRSYTVSEECAEVNDYIYALDEALAQYESQLDGIEITNMELVYRDNGSEGEKLPDWNVEVADILLAGVKKAEK